MACPTCSHTMQKVSGEGSMYWCPRCGTLRYQETMTETTKLVDRCREFEATLGPSWKSLWHRLGIEEAINLPEDR
jgi:tRNA(Ile2) C34 agmatinyltransferase TiaS